MSRIPTLTRVLSHESNEHLASQSRVLASVADPLLSLASAIPAVRKHRLMEIPLSQLSQHSAWTATGYWQGDFDCALWLRTPTGLQQPVQLAVCYRDSQGDKTLFVDRCAAGSYRSALLNGPIHMVVNGKVSELGVYLVGVGDVGDVSVDEWHFVARQKRSK